MLLAILVGDYLYIRLHTLLLLWNSANNQNPKVFIYTIPLEHSCIIDLSIYKVMRLYFIWLPTLWWLNKSFDDYHPLLVLPERLRGLSTDLQGDGWYFQSHSILLSMCTEHLAASSTNHLLVACSCAHKEQVNFLMKMSAPTQDKL